MLVVAGAIIPAQAALAATRAGAAQASGQCSTVEFIGARGSGQPYDIGGRFGGLGPEVSHMIGVVQGELGGKGLSYGTDALAYPADSANDLKPTTAELLLIADPLTVVEGLAVYYEDNVKKFLDSISTGVSDAISDADGYHAACGPAVFVFVGYSQGAMVMHQAEVQLKSKDPQVFGQIAGTILLADGNRVVNTKAMEFGTSKPNAQGIETYLTSLNSHPDVPLPATTANICDAGDVVCDFNASAVLHFSSAVKVHTSYSSCTTTSCTYQTVLATAADWVASAVLQRLLS